MTTMADNEANENGEAVAELANKRYGSAVMALNALLHEEAPRQGTVSQLIVTLAGYERLAEAVRVMVQARDVGGLLEVTEAYHALVAMGAPCYRGPAEQEPGYVVDDAPPESVSFTHPDTSDVFTVTTPAGTKVQVNPGESVEVAQLPAPAPAPPVADAAPPTPRVTGDSAIYAAATALTEVLTQIRQDGIHLDRAGAPADRTLEPVAGMNRAHFARVHGKLLAFTRAIIDGLNDVVAAALAESNAKAPPNWDDAAEAQIDITVRGDIASMSGLFSEARTLAMQAIRAKASGRQDVQFCAGAVRVNVTRNPQIEAP